MVHIEVTTGEFCDIPWGKVQSKLKLKLLAEPFTLQEEAAGVGCGECPRQREQNLQITKNGRECGKIGNVNPD